MSRTRLFLAFLALLAGGSPVLAAEGPADVSSAYIAKGSGDILDRYAPIFVIEHDEIPYNKIGTPSARIVHGEKSEVFVDAKRPAIYTQVETFDTDREHYTNLIYRIHFERNPFTLVPLNVGAGKNVGAIVVVTLNGAEEPVWVTSVQSCGCYHAIIPTDYLPEDAWPDGWEKTGFQVYGEQLPGELQVKGGPADGRIVVTIRGNSHRCKGVSVESEEAIRDRFPVVPTPLVSIETLKSLPLPEGGETSFYHTDGRKKGLVKGAHKPFETVLFGLWAWDHNVGQDREYGPKEEVGRRFYTTLYFKNKKPSDMWHFAEFLEHNGWKP